MNTNLILKRIESANVSLDYVANYCKVTRHYLGQCLHGSKPMTKNLLRKIKNCLKDQVTISEIKKPAYRTEPTIIIKKEEPTVVYKNRSLKETLVAFGEHFGISQHNMEFENGKYHYIFQLDVSEIEE